MLENNVKERKLIDLVSHRCKNNNEKKTAVFWKVTSRKTK
jgi:hypothetical protein